MVKDIKEENNEVEGLDAQLSSYELLWKAGFNELDVWVKRLNDLDEAFLNATKHYTESIKRNQDNFKAITEQFSKELRQWEKGANEELLMTTTTLQHIFPINSYEEINGVVDEIQKKTTSIFATPIRSLSELNGQAIDKYLETVEQFIDFRKKGREKYVDSVKKTTNVVFENQKIFVNLFTNQVKSAIFPYQQYMRSATEPTKS